MNNNFGIILLMFFFGTVNGQPHSGAGIAKKIINSEAYEQWPAISAQKISNNGKYVSYMVRTGEGTATLVLQASDNSWKRSFSNAFNASFSSDNHFAFIQLASDSLVIYDTRTGKVDKMPAVTSYKTAEHGGQQWLAYTGEGPSVSLTIKNLATGSKYKFQNVADYQWCPQGKTLLLQTWKEHSSKKTFQLIWISPSTGQVRVIFRSENPATDFTFDKEGRQLAFICESNGERALWYYQQGLGEAIVRISPENPSLGRDMEVGAGNIRFSQNGRKIFFPIRYKKEQLTEQPGDEVPRLDLWSYTDTFLQPEQKRRLREESDRNFRAVINAGDTRVIRLESEADDWTTFETADGGNAEFVALRTRYDLFQEHWNSATKQSLFLVSTKDGRRITVAKNIMQGYRGSLYAPKGNYLLWYDRVEKNYFTYNIHTGKVCNISESVPVPLYDDEDDHPRLPRPIGIAGWLGGDTAVLVYDRYDIWQLDPEGKKRPVNITNGYGRRNRTYLRYLPTGSAPRRGSVTIKEHTPLLLCGFDRSTKENGFLRKSLCQPGDPVVMTMGPYLFYYCFNFLPVPELGMRGNFLLKARDAEVYFLHRMTAEKYPNLYITPDFKHLTPITDLDPQKEYNWLRSELVHWRTFEGKDAEGILYKPENFDPGKRYPIIFYFYEKDANILNGYLMPDYTDGQINIPTFVSNGYLVFVPNIYYTVGHPRKSVYNSVVSAARHLSRERWVDSTKMGIQGHSFGGYEVNCLVSRTGIFAAAVSAAGFSDLVSMYGNLRTDFGATGLDWIEAGQTGIGATLWEKPELFIENSPIFFADKVTTPLLIMHNKQDGASPFSQSVEFFSALRRLQKKVWLLQYDGGGHQVSGKANRNDFTIRLLQFFDHYLKGAPAPHWLKEGIPARLKGRELGLRSYKDNK